MAFIKTTAQTPAVVLDTNAVLDWLVFKDARIAPLAAAVEARAVRWLVCAGMRDELERVLGYRSLACWLPDSERVLSSFDRWVQVCERPAFVAQRALVCSDPDDQVFIDLALAQQTRWLVTHDRALLKLARRARDAGVQILRPPDWARSPAPA